MTTPIPKGRKLAAYIRVSDDSQVTESQKQTISKWAEKHKLALLLWFEDSEGKNPRDKASKRPEFQRMLKAVEAGLIDTIIVDRQDRFGTKNAWELGKFLTFLDEHGVELWSASQGLISGDDDATVLTSTLGAITSRREQQEKAHRSVRGKISKAEDGLYQGGYPPHGLDVVCYGTDGTEKWRVVWYGHFRRTKVYPDGRREQFDGKHNFPARDKHDELRYRPSIEVARIAVVVQVFEWYALEDISERQIATRLRLQGVDSVYGEWEKVRIKQLLRNPAYIGLPAWNKRGGSRFVEYVGGEIKEVEDRTASRPRTPKDFVQPRKPEFPPIVPIPLWESVANKIKEIEAGLTPAQKKRAPRTGMEEFWLGGFLRCGRCDKPMRRNKAKGTDRLKPNYFCANYGTFGPDNPTGCRCHRVNAEIVHEIVERYLDSVREKVDLMQSQPLEMLRMILGFYRDASRAADELQEIMDEIMRLFGSVTIDDARRFFEDHPGILERRRRLSIDDVRDLCNLIDQKSTDRSNELLRLEERHERMALAFLELPPHAQAKARSRLLEIESEILRLKAQEGGLAARCDRVLSYLTNLVESATAAKESLQTGEHRRKSELLKRVIDRVVCHFRYTDRKGRPTKKKSLLERVEIYPADGEPICFTDGSWPVPGSRRPGHAVG